MEDIKINEQFIRNYLETNNKSLNNLAFEIGISPATLSRILNGKRNPGQFVIGRMLSYFNVKFEVLFSYGDILTNVNEHKPA